MYSKKMLSNSLFYISAYLERNRDEYYERLLAISSDRNWNGWISFFPCAIVEQSEENIQKATQIMGLYDDMKQNVP
ncbi:MAG: hypothetical protein U9N43_08360 [Euryarchaeota archaeon]|nr:hypothetical protein [Euryarchaeota archaeon]